MNASDAGELRAGEVRFLRAGQAVKLATEHTPRFFPVDLSRADAGETAYGVPVSAESGAASYRIAAPAPGPPSTASRSAAPVPGAEVPLAYTHTLERLAGGASGFRVWATVTNTGEEDLLLDWISPFWCGEPFADGPAWPGVDVAELRMIRQPQWMGGGGVVSLDRARREYGLWGAKSYWFGFIAASSQLPALAAGAASWANAQTALVARVHAGRLGLALVAELASDLHGSPLRLRPGAHFSLQPLTVCGGATLDAARAAYASVMRSAVDAPRRGPHGGIFTGYAMASRSGRAEKIADPAFFERIRGWAEDARARDYGLTVFKTQFSRFSTGPRSKIPPPRGSCWPNDDCEALIPQVLRHGFVPDYDLAERFPDGVRPMVEAIAHSGYTPALDSRPFLNFDASAPKQDELAAELYRSIVEQWGYRYLMFDFISTDFATNDDTRTMSQAVRERFVAVRRAVGEDVFLEACMCGLAPVLGVADGYRPAEDWRPGAEAAMASEIACRTALHGEVIQYDFEFVDPSLQPACWDMWANRAVHTLGRVRTAVSLAAMSGYSTLIGGFVDELSGERWELFTRAVPPDGIGAVPLDYPEHDPPAIWRKTREVAGRELAVCAVFNWDENRTAEIGIPLGRLAPGATSDRLPLYLFHFWDERVERIERSGHAPDGPDGEYRLTLGPSECSVILMSQVPEAASAPGGAPGESPSRIGAGADAESTSGGPPGYPGHTADGRPCFLGTDRHITGDPGLVSLGYDEATEALFGRIEYTGATHVSLYVSRPAHRIPAFDECRNVTCELPDPFCVRLRVRFDDGRPVDFSVPFEDGAYVL